MNLGIMCHSSFGGSVRIATDLASELVQRGHRVHLFSRTTPFNLWGNACGIDLHRSMADSDTSVHPSLLFADWPEEEVQPFLSKILHVIRTEGLDLVHLHYAVPFAFIAREIKKSLGTACPCMIGTLHGSDVHDYGRHPVKGPELASTLKELDGLTTVSKNYALLAQSLFNLAEYPEVIPNFVTFVRQDSGDDRTLDHSQVAGSGHRRKTQKKKKIITHISNFRPVKDLRSVVSIFLGIRQQMECELWLVGDGPEMAKIRSDLHGEAYQNDVRCWGLLPAIAPILYQSDLLLMASRAESFGLCALEAMACGVPVLAPRVGGLPEVVVHGKTGFLFPADNHEVAVDYALGLFNDPPAWQAMQRASLKQAGKFKKHCIVTRYEEFYARVLERKENRFPGKWRCPSLIKGLGFGHP